MTTGERTPREGPHPRLAAQRPDPPSPASAAPRRRLAPQANRSNALHPGAWWIWALGLGTAASRTSNPLLLALLIGVAGYVVAARRTEAPWARSYGAFVKLGLAVIGIRLVFAVFLGSPIPGTHTVVSLPEIPLPDWAQGVRVGGRVTAEALVFALYDGLKLATLLICVGAANALANPARLLKSLPGALYEAGVAVVVALTFAPHLIADVQRLRAARRLRGRPDTGLRGLLQVGLPVLEGALERSVALAAAMDARGYGRTARVPDAVRRTTAVLTLGGLVGVCAGTYGLLTAEGTAYGLPVLLAGLVAALAGLRLGGRRSVRTRYRPDVWGPRSWLVAASGMAVAAALIVSASYDPAALRPGVVPLSAPTLPLLPAAAVLLLGLLPALVAPAPPPRTSGTAMPEATAKARPTSTARPTAKAPSEPSAAPRRSDLSKEPS
ncbi:energy-coupling factor transporter transmembrane component T [Streptomyces jeddahensis]|uniref:Cobalt transport protein n=1 Tax=Streptomyces jeddahensis TaxID=1716141 RepID=A0A177HPF3_9ACTN|nr:energy-coupling factor transporter transmembrane component T [Streptomyces jeddahensis]OAH12892.1 cobalt transport protein [Streptomyces jeddahensis]